MRRIFQRAKPAQESDWRFRSRSILIAFGFVALTVGCSSGESVWSSRSASTNDAEVSLLFSVIAPSMEITVEGSGLKLSMPSNSPTAWFTDRPERSAGNITLEDLVSMWEGQGFDQDPPNAALAVTVNGEQRQHIVELTDPKIGDGTVTFHSSDIGTNETTDAVAGKDATHSVSVGTYGPSELFIDSATTRVCPSSITTPYSAPCLIGVTQSLTFQATVTHSNQYVQLSRSVTTTGMSGTLTTPSRSYVVLLESQDTYNYSYVSGEKWVMKDFSPTAAVFTFGTPSCSPGAVCS